MKLNWNFFEGGGEQNKKASEGGVWIFSGTTQSTAGFFHKTSQKRFQILT